MYIYAKLKLDIFPKKKIRLYIFYIYVRCKNAFFSNFV